MVAWRRSPLGAGPAGWAGAGGAGAAASGGEGRADSRVPGGWVSGWPQARQNLAVGDTACPHCGQPRSRDEPHSSQKRASDGFP